MTQTTELTYKWSHPYEWLTSLIQTRINANDHDGVQALLMAIINSGKLDGDDIQDMFQSEMDEDGYFKPLVNDALIGESAGKLVTISYTCRLLNPGDSPEEGIEDGKFTGGRDTWGKWTFVSEDGETTRYFFTDEIETIEAV